MREKIEEALASVPHMSFNISSTHTAQYEYFYRAKDIEEALIAYELTSQPEANAIRKIIEEALASVPHTSFNISSTPTAQYEYFYRAKDIDSALQECNWIQRRPTDKRRLP